MKTKCHFLFIFTFLIFLSASGQKNISSVACFSSSVSKNFTKACQENPHSIAISDPGKNILQPELDRHLDSIYEYDWDTTDWALRTKNHKFRNSNGWLTEDLYVVKNQSTGNWSNYVHFLYTYPGSDQDYTSLLGEVWTNASNWLTYEYTHYIKKNLADSTYTKDWNSLKQKFISGSQIITTYDSLDSMTQKLTQKLDTASSSWKNDYLKTFTYTSQHLISEEVFQNWNATSSEWIYINRKVENYDTNNFLIEHMEYVWDDTASAWKNSSRISFINDPAGNHLTSLTETWNNTSLVWEPFGQSTFYYSLLEWKLSERQQVYNKVTMQFEDSYYIYYTYFTDGTLQSATGNFWKPITNEWVTDQYLLIDSTQNISESYVKFHDNTTYELTGGVRVAYTYSAKQQLVNILNQELSKTVDDWINSEQTDYSYNVNKLLDKTIDQNWDTITSSWLNSKRSLYFYSEPFGINETRNDKNLCNFANPMRAGSMINCPDFNSGEVYYLKIYTLSGAWVYTTRFVGGNTVSVSASVPDGLYVMQFTAENGRVLSNNKVVLLK